MRRFVIASVIVSPVIFAGCQNSASTPKTAQATPTRLVSVGEPMKSTAAPVPAALVLKDTAKYEGQVVRVSGAVTSVCEKKGCWLRLSDPAAGKKDVFVKLTCPADEGGRIVPLEAKGQQAIVEGIVTTTEMDEDQARHYAEDAGATPEELAKIVGPQKQVTIKSPSVQIKMKQ